MLVGFSPILANTDVDDQRNLQPEDVLHDGASQLGNPIDLAFAEVAGGATELGGTVGASYSNT